MSDDAPRDLRRHAEAALDDARLERQWGAIESALPAGGGQRRRLPWAALAATATLAAAVGLWLSRPEPAPQLAAGASVSSEANPIAMRLNDGSSVELSPQSELKLERSDAAAVELELTRGRVHFDVEKRPGRRFEVRAGSVRVRVVGTRFDVENEPRAAGSEIAVSVTRGVVEVLRPGAPVMRIAAGERWSTRLEPAPAVQRTTSEGSAEPAEEPVAAEGEAAEADEAQPSERPLVGRNARERPASAQDLFAQATLARRAGRMQEAADAYAELLERHRDDARAGLAAFELGRIRMDALHERSGAIDAFQQALTLSPAAAFHEDALARIVVALDAGGDAERCRQARERYLSRYPGGVHAAALATRCGE